MRIVLLTGDLTVVSRVEGAAGRMGATLHTAASLDQLADCCNAAPADVVMVDLATPAVDMHALVKDVKMNQLTAPRIVAFGPHVHELRLAAARQAGCDEVVSRGQFFSQLDSILVRCVAG
jgi:DNA-binding NtrC family response regulator